MIPDSGHECGLSACCVASQVGRAGEAQAGHVVQHSPAHMHRACLGLVLMHTLCMAVETRSSIARHDSADAETNGDALDAAIEPRQSLAKTRPGSLTGRLVLLALAVYKRMAVSGHPCCLNGRGSRRGRSTS